MKTLISNNWEKVLLLGLALLIIYPLFFPGYFSHHDDLQVIRIFEMKQCFLDFQIPCRWSSNMGFGYGLPIFNYYNPLPYYLGGVASFLIGFVNSAKLLFFIPLFFSGFTLYLFAKTFMPKKAAFLSALLYTFAPYRALDSYVRGAIGESFAILIAPLVFYFSMKITEENSKKFFLGLSISFAAFLISHTISVLLWFPVFIFWLGFLVYLKGGKNILNVLLALVFGIGLSAFFIVPAFLEKSLISDINLISGDLNFRNHFASVKQLFLEKSWGYGASVFGLGDLISFQIGLPHWILGAFSCLLVFFYRKKLQTKTLLMSVFLFIIFGFSIFMTHNKSSFVWETFDLLKYIQFPWRYLSVAVFSISLLGGFLLMLLKGFWSKLLLITMSLITILLNFSYFKPQHYLFEMNDEQKLSGVEFENQIKGSAFDYLPKTASEPKNLAKQNLEVVKGEAVTRDFNKTSKAWDFNINAKDQVEVKVPVFVFPGWEVFLDESKTSYTYDSDGLIKVMIPVGEHLISGKFTNTRIRTFSNWISVFSLVALSIILKYDKKILFR